MNITEIKVPFGIRYISEWKEFTLQRFPHILDKQIPGCGFTEYCLTNDMDLILVCPRKMILENKKEQHSGQVYYAESVVGDLNVDKDISSIPDHKTKVISLAESIEADKKAEEKRISDQKLAQEEYTRLYQDIMNYWYECQGYGNRPCKILVTYDSYRKVRDILEKLKIFDQFYTVVDEFQSIFVDSRFKSSTELEFISALQGIRDVCYVSATPMLETYLEMIPEFASLPYYRIDWVSEDPGRVSKPALNVYSLRSVTTVTNKIIDSYKRGEFKIAPRVKFDGTVELVESKEAVFYMNSINSIIKSIIAADLKPDQVNILCAKTPENLKRIQAKLGKEWIIGKVPLRGKLHKMFTFCTRTVYLGTDFYSDNARSFILSDANIDSMAVDISLDLPQILGRQRLIENPWKNKADLYIKTLRGDSVSMTAFKEMISAKVDKSKELLEIYQEIQDPKRKQTLAEKYESAAVIENYRKDYIAIDRHSSSIKVPVINNLALIAEQRAYDIQQLDYADRFSVFSRISSVTGGNSMSKISREIYNFQEVFEGIKNFQAKFRYLCEYPFSSKAVLINVLDILPDNFKLYYTCLGPERCKSLGYNLNLLKKDLNVSTFDLTKVKDSILQEFLVGEKISSIEIRSKLKIIYDQLNYSKTVKANDLEDYFELKPCKVKDPSGKWVHGFELVKLK